MMTPSKSPSRLMSAGIAAAVLAIPAAVGVAYLEFFRPKAPPERVVPSDGHDRAAFHRSGDDRACPASRGTAPPRTTSARPSPDSAQK